MNEPIIRSPLVILAAGKGTRIRVGDQSLPKPLVEVGGIPLLKRCILTANQVGIDRFVVITGYDGERVRTAIEQDSELQSFEIIWVHHDQYDLNNGVSVLQARPFVNEPFFITMADHVLTSELYTTLAGAPSKGDLALAVDYKLQDIFDMEDATKVLLNQTQQIIDIGKEIQKYNAVDTGLFFCTPKVFDILQNCLDETGNASMSEGVQRLSILNRAFGIDIGAGWWQDVDDLSTRAHAEQLLKQYSKQGDFNV